MTRVGRSASFAADRRASPFLPPPSPASSPAALHGSSPGGRAWERRASACGGPRPRPAHPADHIEARAAEAAAAAVPGRLRRPCFSPCHRPPIPRARGPTGRPAAAAGARRRRRGPAAQIRQDPYGRGVGRAARRAGAVCAARCVRGRVTCRRCGRRRGSRCRGGRSRAASPPRPPPGTPPPAAAAPRTRKIC